jgi:hypothetical protein
MAAATLLAGGLAPPAPFDAASSTPPPPPGGSASTLTWSVSPDRGTHAYAVQYAAALVEGGFSDWRLPTVEELQAAVTDADPATFGQAQYPNGSNAYWSSKTQGKMWAFAIQVVSDANSYPIPAQSGGVLKVTLPKSTMWYKCVRP